MLKIIIQVNMAKTKHTIKRPSLFFLLLIKQHAIKKSCRKAFSMSWYWTAWQDTSFLSLRPTVFQEEFYEGVSVTQALIWTRKETAQPYSLAAPRRIRQVFLICSLACHQFEKGSFSYWIIKAQVNSHSIMTAECLGNCTIKNCQKIQIIYFLLSTSLLRNIFKQNTFFK